ncbi:MAG TPA: hypothetical protein DEP35_16360 [Deltaproteobacteria bacterium]|nr:hypothetical protein [Deltaproteobacteria bacterium]
MSFDSPGVPGPYPSNRAATRCAARSPLRLWLARLVWAVHLGVVAFFAFGWLLPWRSALWGVAIGVPTLQLTWRLMGDRCPLTWLEQALRGNHAIGPAPPDDREGPPNFVTRLLTAILGRAVSQRASDRLVNRVAWSGFSIAVLRLAF